MIKYRAWCAMAEIKLVEILRETEKMVVIAAPDGYFHTIGERKELKKTENYAHFDTWQEAHDYMIAVQEKRIQDVETTLMTEKSILEKILAMKEDKS